MMKMLVNQSLYAQGLHQTQLLGTFFDGIARHTEEGHGFVRRAAEGGFKEAVRERDEPFGDFGLGGFGCRVVTETPASLALDRRRRRRLRRRWRGGDAAARRLRGRDRLREGRAGRRRLEPQHLPGRRLRRPLAPLRVLLRAQPLVAPLRAAGGDPGLRRGRRTALRRARQGPHRHRGEERSLGRGARAGGGSRPAPGRTRPRSCSPPAASSRSPRRRRSRAWRASTGPPSTPPSGATTSTSPASASP